MNSSGHLAAIQKNHLPLLLPPANPSPPPKSPAESPKIGRSVPDGPGTAASIHFESSTRDHTMVFFDWLGPAISINGPRFGVK